MDAERADREPTASPIGSRAETIDFVSWSATIASARDHRQGDPLRAPGAERPLGARDRLQRVRRRADPDVDPPRRIAAGGLAQPCSWRRLSSRQRIAYGIGVEAPLRDRGAADGARSVGPGLDALKGLVDLGDDVVGVLAERLVELAVDEIGRVIGEVLVAGGGVDLALTPVVGGEVGGGAENALAQPQQLGAPECEIDGHRRPLLGGGEALLGLVEREPDELDDLVA